MTQSKMFLMFFAQNRLFGVFRNDDTAKGNVIDLSPKRAGSSKTGHRPVGLETRRCKPQGGDIRCAWQDSALSGLDKRSAFSDWALPNPGDNAPLGLRKRLSQ